MKKKVMAVLLAAAMVTACLAGCGGSNNSGSSDSGSAPAADSSEVDFGSGDIKLWVPDAVVATTQNLVDQFFAAHSEMAGYKVSIEPMGEGDAAGNMITDVEAGADIYGFAQDQLARLVAAGALTTINGD